MVVRAVPAEEAKHIARSYFTSELAWLARNAIHEQPLNAISISQVAGIVAALCLARKIAKLAEGRRRAEAMR